MNCKMYSINDYPILVNMWLSYDFPPPPAHALPQTGVIIQDSKSEEYLAAGFLYKTDSSITWIEWIVGNKKCDKMVRVKAIYQLIDKLAELAKSSGFETLFTSSSNLSLNVHLVNNKFKTTDKNVTHFLRSL